MNDLTVNWHDFIMHALTIAHTGAAFIASEASSTGALSISIAFIAATNSSIGTTIAFCWQNSIQG